ncbi:ceramide synthase Lac1p [Monosporozyma unispora]|nr:sphingosine N-acyltransferase lag1 [Kazachstania unispora]
MSMSTGSKQSLQPVTQRHTRSRRSSSVGKIDLGDTVHSITSKHGTTATTKIPTKSWSSSNSFFSFVKTQLYYYSELITRRVWLPPLLIISTIYALYFSSNKQTPTNPLHMFVAISYQIGDTDMYGKGIKDLCFVFFYMIFFTFLRDFIMDVFIRPFALRVADTKHKQKRIMEQTFYIIYYGISGPFGLYIMYGTDLWLFKTKTMYATYPDFNNPYLYKIFYLGQAAFWTQQACVLALQLEKPRKDYYELIFHHIVTLLLIWLSYVFHFSKMGLAIFITMDISDCLLALSKTLNYLDSSLTAPIFIIFMFTWIYLRHVINIKILWSVLTEFRTVGEYRLNFAVQQYKCWISLIIVFLLIFALQLVNLYWLFLIFRILYRLLFKGIQADERSEAEEDDDDEEEEETESVEESVNSLNKDIGIETIREGVEISTLGSEEHLTPVKAKKMF